MSWRRVGKFTINRNMIETHPDLVKKLMGMVIVLRAESDYYTDSIEYFAISDHFRTVEEGCIPLKYEVEVDSELDSIRFKEN